jgi:V8-like Glu-specific endopeptidase
MVTTFVVIVVSPLKTSSIRDVSVAFRSKLLAIRHDGRIAVKDVTRCKHNAVTRINEDNNCMTTYEDERCIS